MVGRLLSVGRNGVFRQWARAGLGPEPIIIEVWFTPAIRPLLHFYFLFYSGWFVRVRWTDDSNDDVSALRDLGIVTAALCHLQRPLVCNRVDQNPRGLRYGCSRGFEFWGGIAHE